MEYAQNATLDSSSNKVIASLLTLFARVMTSLMEIAQIATQDILWEMGFALFLLEILIASRKIQMEAA